MRTSSKLFFHFQRAWCKTPVPLFPREITSDLNCFFIAAATSHVHRLPRNELFASPVMNWTRVQCGNRCLHALADPVAHREPQISSRQRKIKERSALEEAFESAKTIDEMLRAFKEMELSVEEKDLGMACLKVGLMLDRESEDHEKTLSFAQRAFRILGGCDDPDGSSKFSLPVAMALQLLGSCCFKLKKFSDSLGYLNKANRVLSKLEMESSCASDEILPILHAVQLELFNVKTAIGRREDALFHLKKALEIKEKSLEEGSRELGKANRDVAEAYVAVLNFNEALVHCLKALEIHTAHLGNNSVEVAYDRKLLGVIYSGLEEHGKALEQNQLSQKIMKKWGCSPDLLRAEIDAANMQIALGRYDEAIDALKGVLQQTDKDSEDRALILTSMAKAFCSQDKFADAKGCLKMACEILGKQRSCPLSVAEAYSEIAMQYEVMNEFETAISLLKRAISMMDKLPQEQHSVGSVSARVGWLLLLTGRVDQAIPYLEDAAERLKESFGSNHYGVGYVYNNLGAAYLELGRPQSAAQVFAYAKEIMDVSLGPHHVDSIEACQNLSKAYASMGSYPLALSFQEKVVEAYEGHGASAEDELKDAVSVLELLKEKASAAVAETLMQALPQDEDTGAPESPQRDPLKTVN